MILYDLLDFLLISWQGTFDSGWINARGSRPQGSSEPGCRPEASYLVRKGEWTQVVV